MSLTGITLLTWKHIFSEFIFLASAINFLASSFENEKTQPIVAFQWKQTWKLLHHFKIEMHLREFERNCRRAGCSEVVVSGRVLFINSGIER